MHKPVILITAASDKYEAIQKAQEFLESYKDDVWDWYQIGGRWTGTLAPGRDEYDKWATAFIKQKLNDNPKWQHYLNEAGEYDSFPQSVIDDNTSQFEMNWHRMGFEGPSPYSNHYKLPKEGGAYDVVPLADAVHVLPEWITDREKKKETSWNKMIEEKEGKKSYDLSYIYAKEYYDVCSGNFSWEFDSYDIGDQEPLSNVPEETEGKWAIMVDMHN